MKKRFVCPECGGEFLVVTATGTIKKIPGKEDKFETEYTDGYCKKCDLKTRRLK